MYTRVPMVLVVLILGVLLGAPTESQAKEQADPIWIPYCQTHLPMYDTTVNLPGGQQAELGDPRLGQWAIKQISRVNRMDEDELYKPTFPI